MLSKIKKYINVICVCPINKLKTYHNRLLQLTETDLVRAVDRNPYQVFIDWCIDKITIGVIVAVPYTYFFGIESFPRMIWMIISFGLIPDIIDYLRKSIVGEK